MTYQVLIKRSAEKALDDLPERIRARITTRLLNLEENPRPYRSKKLLGQNAYRIQVGEYRVLYTIDDSDKLVTIMDVGHRRDVYR